MPGFEELHQMLAGEELAKQLDEEMTMTEFQPTAEDMEGIDRLVASEEDRTAAIAEGWTLYHQHGYNRLDAFEIVRRRLLLTGDWKQQCEKAKANQEGDEIVFRCGLCECRIGQITGGDFEQYRYDELQRFAWRMMMEHVCHHPPFKREDAPKAPAKRSPKAEPVTDSPFTKRRGVRVIRIGIEYD